MYCHNCGTNVQTNMQFCPQCGSEQQYFVPDPEKTEKISVGSAEQPVLVKKKKKFLIPVAVLLVICIIGGSVLGWFLSRPKEKDFAIYEKNEELYLSYLSGDKEAIRLTNNYGSADDRYNPNWTIDKVFYDERSTKLFFCDEVNVGESMTLNYMELSAKKEDQKKIPIEKKVAQYAVLKGGNAIFYIKENGTLFFYDFKEKMRLDSDVSALVTNKAGDTAIYLTYDEKNEQYGIYTADRKGNVTLIADDVDNYYHNKTEDSLAFKSDPML